MIKGIIFDYDGVISNPGIFDFIFKKYCDEFNLDYNEFSKEMYGVWRDAETSKIDSIEFWKRLSEYTGKEIDEIKKEWQFEFLVDEEMLNFAKKLKIKYKLAILTNNICDRINPDIKKYKLNEIFDEIIISENAKTRKPFKKIYEIVLEKLNLEADECVFIDDKERNILGGKELGIKGIVFEDIEKLKEELKDFEVNI